jgi:hypothetical protein
MAESPDVCGGYQLGFRRSWRAERNDSCAVMSVEASASAPTSVDVFADTRLMPGSAKSAVAGAIMADAPINHAQVKRRPARTGFDSRFQAFTFLVKR